MRGVALMLKERPAGSSRSAMTMADKKSGSAGDKPARQAGGEEGKKPEAFDIWLQRGLHQLYDSVAKEPIPDDLLRLIEQDKADRSE